MNGYPDLVAADGDQLGHGFFLNVISVGEGDELRLRQFLSSVIDAAEQVVDVKQGFAVADKMQLPGKIDFVKIVDKRLVYAIVHEFIGRKPVVL